MYFFKTCKSSFGAIILNSLITVIILSSMLCIVCLSSIISFWSILMSVCAFLLDASMLFSIRRSLRLISPIRSSDTLSLPANVVSCSVAALGCSCGAGFEPKNPPFCDAPVPIAGGGGIGGGGISAMVNVYIVSLFYILLYFRDFTRVVKEVFGRWHAASMKLFGKGKISFLG